MNGRVILYADKETESMQRAMGETSRRRTLQVDFNREHGITPRTIEKEIRKGVEEILRAKKRAADAVQMSENEFDKVEALAELEKEMFASAKRLEFERAAQLRDDIKRLTGQAPPPARRGGPKPRPRPGRRGRALRSRKAR